MVYVLGATIVALVGVVVWLARRAQLAPGPRTFALCVMLFVALSLLLRALSFPTTPWWLGVGLGVVAGVGMYARIAALATALGGPAGQRSRRAGKAPPKRR